MTCCKTKTIVGSMASHLQWDVDMSDWSKKAGLNVQGSSKHKIDEIILQLRNTDIV